MQQPSPLSSNEVPPFVLQTLQGSGTYELLSLDPNGLGKDQMSPDAFHGFRVLGRTTVTDKETRQALNDALQLGAKENQGAVAACFNPRHGLHVISRGQVVDLVICFECAQVQAYNGGGERNNFLVAASPQPVFDEVLTAAKVPLAAAAE